MLVEANPRDWVWGAGVAEGQAEIEDPARWRGTNLLGRVLTKLRDDLAGAPPA